MNKLIFILGFITIYISFSCAPKYSQGESLYKNFCSNCHGVEGEGLRSLYPPLKNSDYLLKNQDNLPCIIRYGIAEPIMVNEKEFTTPMLGIEDLNEVEINNLVNFIQMKWGNKKSYNSLKDVKIKLEGCK